MTPPRRRRRRRTRRKYGLKHTGPKASTASAPEPEKRLVRSKRPPESADPTYEGTNDPHPNQGPLSTFDPGRPGGNLQTSDGRTITPAQAAQETGGTSPAARRATRGRPSKPPASVLDVPGSSLFTSPTLKRATSLRAAADAREAAKAKRQEERTDRDRARVLRKSGTAAILERNVKRTPTGEVTETEQLVPKGPDSAKRAQRRGERIAVRENAQALDRIQGAVNAGEYGVGEANRRLEASSARIADDVEARMEDRYFKEVTGPVIRVNEREQTDAALKELGDLVEDIRTGRKTMADLPKAQRQRVATLIQERSDQRRSNRDWRDETALEKVTGVAGNILEWSPPGVAGKAALAAAGAGVDAAKTGYGLYQDLKDAQEEAGYDPSLTSGIGSDVGFDTAADQFVVDAKTGTLTLLTQFQRPVNAAIAGIGKAGEELGILKGPSARRIRKAPGVIGAALDPEPMSENLIRGSDIATGLGLPAWTGLSLDLALDPLMYSGFGAARAVPTALARVAKLEASFLKAGKGVDTLTDPAFMILRADAMRSGKFQAYIDVLDAKRVAEGVGWASGRETKEYLAFVRSKEANAVMDARHGEITVGKTDFRAPGRAMEEATAQAYRSGAMREIVPGFRISFGNPLRPIDRPFFGGKAVLDVRLPKWAADSKVIPRGLPFSGPTKARLADKGESFLGKEGASLRGRATTADGFVSWADLADSYSRARSMREATRVSQSHGVYMSSAVQKLLAEGGSPILRATKPVGLGKNVRVPSKESLTSWTGAAKRSLDRVGAYAQFRHRAQSTKLADDAFKHEPLTAEEREALDNFDKIFNMLGAQGKDIGYLQQTLKYYFPRFWIDDARDIGVHLDPKDFRNRSTDIGAGAGSKISAAKHRSQPAFTALMGQDMMEDILKNLASVPAKEAAGLAKEMHTFDPFRQTLGQSMGILERGGELVDSLIPQFQSKQLHNADELVELVEGKWRLKPEVTKLTGTAEDKTIGRLATPAFSPEGTYNAGLPPDQALLAKSHDIERRIAQANKTLDERLALDLDDEAVESLAYITFRLRDEADDVLGQIAGLPPHPGPRGGSGGPLQNPEGPRPLQGGPAERGEPTPLKPGDEYKMPEGTYYADRTNEEVKRLQDDFKENAGAAKFIRDNPNIAGHSEEEALKFDALNEGLTDELDRILDDPAWAREVVDAADARGADEGALARAADDAGYGIADEDVDPLGMGRTEDELRKEVEDIRLEQRELANARDEGRARGADEDDLAYFEQELKANGAALERAQRRLDGAVRNAKTAGRGVPKRQVATPFVREKRKLVNAIGDLDRRLGETLDQGEALRHLEDGQREGDYALAGMDDVDEYADSVRADLEERAEELQDLRRAKQTKLDQMDEIGEVKYEQLLDASDSGLKREVLVDSQARVDGAKNYLAQLNSRVDRVRRGSEVDPGLFPDDLLSILARERASARREVDDAMEEAEYLLRNAEPEDLGLKPDGPPPEPPPTPHVVEDLPNREAADTGEPIETRGPTGSIDDGVTRLNAALDRRIAEMKDRGIPMWPQDTYDELEARMLRETNPETRAEMRAELLKRLDDPSDLPGATPPGHAGYGLKGGPADSLGGQDRARWHEITDEQRRLDQEIPEGADLNSPVIRENMLKHERLQKEKYEIWQRLGVPERELLDENLARWNARQTADPRDTAADDPYGLGPDLPEQRPGGPGYPPIPVARSRGFGDEHARGGELRDLRQPGRTVLLDPIAAGFYRARMDAVKSSLVSRILAINHAEGIDADEAPARGLREEASGQRWIEDMPDGSERRWEDPTLSYHGDGVAQGFKMAIEGRFGEDTKRLWPSRVIDDFRLESARLGEGTYQEVFEQGIENMFQKTMQTMRFGMTVPFPAYHIRNAISDILKSEQAGGTGMIFHPFVSAKVAAAATRRTKAGTVPLTAGERSLARDGRRVQVPGFGEVTFGRSGKIKLPNTNLELNPEDFLFLMDMYGIRSGQHLAEFMRLSQTGEHLASTKRKGLRALGLGLGPQSPIGKRMLEAGARREDVMRMLTTMQRLRVNGGDMADAAWYTSYHHFDYNNLTAIEKRVMRNLVFFYTWYRKNIPLQFVEMLSRPGWFSGLGNVYQDLTLGETPFNQDWSKVLPFAPDMSGPMPRALGATLPDYMRNPLSAVAVKWNDQAAAFAFGAPWADMNLVGNLVGGIGSVLSGQGDAGLETGLRQAVTLTNPFLGIGIAQTEKRDLLSGRDLNDWEQVPGVYADVMGWLGMETRKDKYGNDYLPWRAAQALRSIPITGRAGTYGLKTPTNARDTGRTSEYRWGLNFFGLTSRVSVPPERITDAWEVMWGAKAAELTEGSFDTPSTFKNRVKYDIKKDRTRDALDWAVQHEIPFEWLQYNAQGLTGVYIPVADRPAPKAKGDPLALSGPSSVSGSVSGPTGLSGTGGGLTEDEKQEKEDEAAGKLGPFTPGEKNREKFSQAMKRYYNHAVIKRAESGLAERSSLEPVGMNEPILGEEDLKEKSKCTSTLPGGTGDVLASTEGLADRRRLSANAPPPDPGPEEAKIQGPREKRAAAALRAAVKKAGTTLEGPLTEGQRIFGETLAKKTGLSAKVIGGWMLAENSGDNAVQKDAENYHNWLNIGPFLQSTKFNDPASGGKATADFLKGKIWGAGANIPNIITTAGQSDEAQMRAIETSGFSETGYGAGATLDGTYAQVTAGQSRPIPKAVLRKARAILGKPAANEIIQGTPDGPKPLSVSELFYDPGINIKDGASTSAIGNHTDHVHFGSTDPLSILRVAKKAQSLGIGPTDSTGENPLWDTIDGNHTPDGYHYRESELPDGRRVARLVSQTGGDPQSTAIGQALDMAGPPEAMAKLNEWIAGLNSEAPITGSTGTSPSSSGGVPGLGVAGAPASGVPATNDVGGPALLPPTEGGVMRSIFGEDGPTGAVTDTGIGPATGGTATAAPPTTTGYGLPGQDIAAAVREELKKYGLTR